MEEATPLLRIAAEILANCPSAMAITHDQAGEMSARAVETRGPDAAWQMRFFTTAASRKLRQIEATGALLLSYQSNADFAYVTLSGRAQIWRGAADKERLWWPELGQWYPRGPSDPGAAAVTLDVMRVELWSAQHKIHPGNGAAAITRAPGENWQVSQT